MCPPRFSKPIEDVGLVFSYRGPLFSFFSFFFPRCPLTGSVPRTGATSLFTVSFFDFFFTILSPFFFSRIRCYTGFVPWGPVSLGARNAAPSDFSVRWIFKFLFLECFSSFLISHFFFRFFPPPAYGLCDAVIFRFT